MSGRVRQILGWLLLAGVLFAGGVRGEASAPSAATGRVVRVAFCAEHGTSECLEGGARVGVVPAWMWRICGRLGWTPEWVDLPYAEALRRVSAGEIDMVGGVAHTPARREKMMFVPRAIGERRLSLYVLKSSPFDERNPSSLAGALVGFVEGLSREAEIWHWFASRGVACTLRSYPTALDVERALLAGEVGAALSDESPRLEEERCLFTLSSQPLYFAFPKKRTEDVTQVARAIAEILEAEPLLPQELRRSYFPRSLRAELGLSSEEHVWLAEHVSAHKAVTVDISPMDPPFKTYDPETGRFAGFIGVLLEELADMTGLQFDYLAPCAEELAAARFARGGTDVWIPFPYGDAAAGRANRAAPIQVDLPEVCCTRRYDGSSVVDETSRLAVWSGDHARLAAYQQLNYVPRLVICETRADCLRIVADGRADATYMPYLQARRLVSDLGLTDRFDVRLIDRQRYAPTVPLCLGPATDPQLAGILRKALQALTRDQLVDLVHRAEAYEKPASGLTWEAMFIGGGLLALFVTLFLFVLTYTSRRRIRAALHRSEMSLRVADDALRDATRAREQMREALDRAEYAARSKTNFLATMSHEIRTPLNAVIGFSEFLSDPQLPPAKVDEYARGISFAANALLSLLNDILDISKFESGRTEGLDMRTGACDVAALFKEMESVFRMKAEAKGLALAFACDAGMPRLELSEPRLRQILLNLLGNAVKFTDRGQVAARAVYRDGALELAVSDTGIGISPRGLKLVFDPFAQDMESRQGRVYAGTGLGLSIVKRLVEASGGTVQVASEIGKGTTFTVVQPARALAAAPETAVAAAPAAPGAAFARIVIVDDTKMNCRVLAAFCRRLGFAEVEVFTSGAETLAWLEAGGACDLVLSDLWMPGMNGSELAREIRRRRPDLPVVAVTADTDAAATFDMGVFRAVLTKPVTTEKLRNLLARLR